MTTGVPREKLSALLESLSRVPEKFHVHPKLKKLLHGRQAMAVGEQPLDWAAGEALAFASLADENIGIRMSGQDRANAGHSAIATRCCTITRRQKYYSLQHVSPKQAPVVIINSPLSETAVLGFEHGQSPIVLESLGFCGKRSSAISGMSPSRLSTSSSGEDKWQQLSGLVLLLPHGFLRARARNIRARGSERFLWLAVEDNIQVVYPTTPAQVLPLFLRRQALRLHGASRSRS